MSDVIVHVSRKRLPVAFAALILFSGGATAVPGGTVPASTGAVTPTALQTVEGPMASGDTTDDETGNGTSKIYDCFKQPLQGDNDPDADVLHEDTTGDGNVTFDDAIELAFQIEEINNNSCPRYYDFDNDSFRNTAKGNYTRVDFDDAIALAFSDEIGNSTAARVAD